MCCITPVVAPYSNSEYLVERILVYPYSSFDFFDLRRFCVVHGCTAGLALFFRVQSFEVLFRPNLFPFLCL